MGFILSLTIVFIIIIFVAAMFFLKKIKDKAFIPIDAHAFNRENMEYTLRQLKVQENRNDENGTYLNTNTCDDHEYQVLIFPDPVPAPPTPNSPIISLGGASDNPSDDSRTGYKPFPPVPGIVSRNLSGNSDYDNRSDKIKYVPKDWTTSPLDLIGSSDNLDSVSLRGDLLRIDVASSNPIDQEVNHFAGLFSDREDLQNLLEQSQISSRQSPSPGKILSR